MLARDLVILMLASQLADDSLKSIERVEIKATLVYLWNGLAMPDYCDLRYVPAESRCFFCSQPTDRVRNTMQDLQTRLTESPARLPKWLVAHSTTVQGILLHLKQWLTIEPDEPGPLLQSHKPRTHAETIMHGSTNADSDPRQRAIQAAKVVSRKKELSDQLKAKSIQELKRINFIDANVSEKEAKRLVREKHDEWVNMIWETESVGGAEEQWYSIFKTYLPPPELRSRHPMFERVSAQFIPGNHEGLNQDHCMKVRFYELYFQI